MSVILFVLFFQTSDSSLLVRAFNLQYEGEIHQALRIYNSIDTTDYSDEEKAEYILYKASALREGNYLEESIILLNESQVLFPQNNTSEIKCGINLLLARISKQLTKYDDAEKYALQLLNSAKGINDSIYIYNAFIELGNINYDQESFLRAEEFFIESLNYINKNDERRRIIVTNNLGEIEYKRKNYQNSLSHFLEVELYFRNLENSYNKNQSRINLAMSFFALNKSEEARKYVEEAQTIAIKNKWLDQSKLLNKIKLDQYLKSINALEAHIYLDSIKKLDGEINKIKLGEIEERYENTKLETLLSTEKKEREISDLLAKKRRVTNVYLGVTLALLAIGSFFFFYNQRLRNRLSISNAYIDRQHALQAQRNQMSQDLHDELGSGLTSIKYISNSIQENKDISKVRDIEKTSNHLILSMRDLLWSLDVSKDNLGTLLSRVRSTCNQFLKNTNIEFEIVDSVRKEIPISGIYRRNIILILKECLTNILKHSQASTVKIYFNQEPGLLNFAIEDNGIGFDIENSSSTGYGLNSIQKRTNELNGRLEITSAPSGTKLIMHIPLD